MSVTFTCRGHAGITGTHDKTLEFTRDVEVTKRATCVLGVASDHDDRALLALRGEVDVTIEAAGHRDSFRATITPFFLGGDGLVFRCGPELRERTIAYDATKSAADVDRGLVRALADPANAVTVTVSETGRGAREGALFVVAVPIGNDDDLSPRARRVLEGVDVVLAEDTRRFRDLARRTGISVDAIVLSYHEHNEDVRAGDALARLEQGSRVALVSDAGTPLASDPGYVVVRDAVEAGVPVSPVPGPSALLAVLAASGLPVDRFTYVGFLPRRAGPRQSALQELCARQETFVVHEAPHRVGALLADLAAVAPDWRVCAGREVTKIFEEFRRGSAAELAAELANDEPRGEFTLVVAPPAARAPVESATAVDLDPLLRALLAQGVTAKTLSQALASLPGTSRKEAYARVLALGTE